MNAELKFDGGYRERIRLPGGEHVRLRLIQPDDKAGLLRPDREALARELGDHEVVHAEQRLPPTPHKGRP